MTKPNVFPTKEQIEKANENIEPSELTTKTTNPKELEVIKQMELEAEEQKKKVENGEKIIREDLKDKKYNRPIATGNKNKESVDRIKPPIEKPVNKPIKQENNMENEKTINYNKPTDEPYDVIPIPSEGKIYRHKKGNIKVGYLNASDEDILTSPNLLETGEFLDLLLDKKILEEGISVKDLHVGDKNAIMIWLRSTGYGPMYPIVVTDDNDKQFETEVDLDTLGYKKLKVDPDKEGLFSFKLNRSNKEIKFKLLTVGEIKEIDDQIKYDISELGLPFSNHVTYRLEKMIKEIDGNRDKDFIKDFIKKMPINDSRELRNYYEEIEPNVDLEIEVEAPGEGGLIKTFLPINARFFWPDFGV